MATSSFFFHSIIRPLPEGFLLSALPGEMIPAAPIENTGNFLKE